jgi:hypothetical protein
MFEASAFWKDWQKREEEKEDNPSQAIESTIRVFKRLSEEHRRSSSPLRRALRRVMWKGKDE